MSDPHLEDAPLPEPDSRVRWLLARPWHMVHRSEPFASLDGLLCRKLTVRGLKITDLLSAERQEYRVLSLEHWGGTGELLGQAYLEEDEVDRLIAMLGPGDALLADSMGLTFDRRELRTGDGLSFTWAWDNPDWVILLKLRSTFDLALPAFRAEEFGNWLAAAIGRLRAE